MDTFPDYDSAPLPPEEFSQVRGSEKVYSEDEFRPTKTVKAPKTPKVIQPISSVAKPASELLRAKEEIIPAGLQLKIKPASEPVVGIPSTKVDTVTQKVGRKPTGTAMTNTERQKKWRMANREVALARQKEAMKKIRSK